MLIRKGILKYPLAAGYIASMCEFGDFETYRKQFFEVIDKAMTITGFSLDYFVPFFNMALVHGDAEDAKAVADKYGVSYKQVADCVYERIIFEIIENDATDSLTFIESYRNWINEKVLGVAVSAGNLKVAEYICLKRAVLFRPYRRCATPFLTVTEKFLSFFRYRLRLRFCVTLRCRKTRE